MKSARAIAVVALFALAGCAAAPLEPVEYVPERTITAAIPPEQARAKLREILGRCHERSWDVRVVTHPVECVEVAELRFTVRSTFDGKSHSFPYSSLRPRALRDPEDGGLVAILRGGPYRSSMLPESLWFADREDLDAFLDAIASLSGTRR